MPRMHTPIDRLSLWTVMLFVTFAGAVGALRAETKAELLELKQIALNEGHVQGYLKIAPDLAKLFERIDAAHAAPDAKLLGDLEALAKRGGFASFEALEIAVANITFVMSGIDEKDGSFREPVELLRQDLTDLEADKEIKGDERAELIASIKESIAHTPKLAHTGNIDVVKKHFKALARHFDDGPG